MPLKETIPQLTKLFVNGRPAKIEPVCTTDVNDALAIPLKFIGCPVSPDTASSAIVNVPVKLRVASDAEP